jgi:6-phosphogluconolactonase
VDHEVRVLGDADAVARAGASVLAEAARAAIAERGAFVAAVSGGRTPWLAFGHLAAEPLDWARVTLFQVDERVAPDGDPDRNLTHLAACFAAVPVTLRPMAVAADDLTAAAAAYAASLPARFDLVHLGLGPDGHTASLVPGDPILEVEGELVGVTAPYLGHRRMTLTYPALARAARLVWLVTGDDKRDALARLVAGDRSIPAGRVTAPVSLVVCDAAAR